MLTANRFDQIKKVVQRYRTMPSAYEEEMHEVMEMLTDLASELDRRNTPTPARTSGPRAVVLDAQGKPLLPPPMVQQFEGERREQYALDRHEALMTLDPEMWRVFSLRWGLPPPPGGWDNHEVILNVMHAVRLGVASIPYLDKHFSAIHLTSKGITLPRVCRYGMVC